MRQSSCAVQAPTTGRTPGILRRLITDRVGLIDRSVGRGAGDCGIGASHSPGVCAPDSGEGSGNIGRDAVLVRRRRTHLVEARTHPVHQAQSSIGAAPVIFPTRRARVQTRIHTDPKDFRTRWTGVWTRSSGVWGSACTKRGSSCAGWGSTCGVVTRTGDGRGQGRASLGMSAPGLEAFGRLVRLCARRVDSGVPTPGPTRAAVGDGRHGLGVSRRRGGAGRLQNLQQGRPEWQRSGRTGSRSGPKPVCVDAHQHSHAP
jgi:hypothetical protein